MKMKWFGFFIATMMVCGVGEAQITRPISALNEITNAELAGGDLLLVVDSSTTSNKKLQLSELDLRYSSAVTGDITIPSGVGARNATIPDGSIGLPKLQSLSSGYLIVGNVSDEATAVPMTGAISMDSSGVTAYVGTVPLNKGGTGQTSKSAAFDALSPMTTGGDLTYGGASGTGTRLPNGTAGQFLRSGGGTSAPSWATAPVRSLDSGSVVIHTTTVLSSSGTIPDTADTIYCNTTSGNVTLAFPATASQKGRRVKIIKSAAANSCIIDPDGSEVVNANGSSNATATLYLYMHSVELVTHGTGNWIVANSENDEFSVRAYNTTTQTVAYATWVTSVFNSESGGEDTHSAFDTSNGTLTSRPPSRCSAVATVSMASFGGIGTLAVRFMVGGSNVRYKELITTATNTSWGTDLADSNLILPAGGTLVFQIFQNQMNPSNTISGVGQNNVISIGCKAKLW